jgi:phospholipid/cholesterol/gamma-HCH transport system substrate-binding protein
MHHRARRFRLGLFVIVAGSMFLALLGFVLRGSLDSDRASYFILFHDNVKGMVVGSRVNFQGVPIGVVADMRFQDGKTLVELLVDPSRASIQDVTRARMDRLLVTGQVTVELEGYGGEGRPLAPGAFIQPKEDPLHSLTASLPEVVQQANAVLTRLERVLGNAEALVGDDTQQRVQSILLHAERSAQRLADETLPAATAMLVDARGAAAAAGRAAEAFADVASAVTRLEGELQALVRESTAMLAAARGPTLSALAGLRTALDDARGLFRQLKLAPDSILFGVRHPAAPIGGER